MKAVAFLLILAVVGLTTSTIYYYKNNPGKHQKQRVLRVHQENDIFSKPEAQMYFHYQVDNECYKFMLVAENGKVLSYIKCDSSKMIVIDSAQTISVLMNYIGSFNDQIFAKDSLLQLMRLHQVGSYFAQLK